MDFVSLLSAFGVGAIVSAVIQNFLTTRSQNKRNAFSERKEAYIGLWEAFQRQDIARHTKESEFDVGHWFLRCELVASEKVLENLRDWTTTTPGSDERIAATKLLKAAMRDDLGISKHSL